MTLLATAECAQTSSAAWWATATIAVAVLALIAFALWLARP